MDADAIVWYTCLSLLHLLGCCVQVRMQTGFVYCGSVVGASPLVAYCVSPVLRLGDLYACDASDLEAGFVHAPDAVHHSCPSQTICSSSVLYDPFP
jgi:hypothetical protein